ncbi:fumarate hydratase class II [Marinicella pacifica]|jgi:fumarate hydratase class II|uniref:Fumarate hydratase class II n=1 Tax=Marinicella pacifica TaxID=1171543 RepID=A0A917CIP2_9GAMM|nr:class II fumarate hydratase [Marinicella pacifica]GGF90034.1 fumarate hydratase class II [Marinicella pacifica]
MSDFRIEKDSMGELKVPADALYGAQTQRAVNNFPISGLTMPPAFIKALGLVKKAAAQANEQLGHLAKDKSQAIQAAADQVIRGDMNRHFPIDVFQTGSGTSSNMNCNEVIAHLASTKELMIHPNDHVNMGQSSNDVVPTAIAVSNALDVAQNLIPAMHTFIAACQAKAQQLNAVVKTGRTHLMDAMPVTFGQELNTWASTMQSNVDRLSDALKRVCQLPQGGTAVGTGVNADSRFGALFAEKISKLSGLHFTSMANKFDGISTQDNIVELSGQLRVSAVTLMKIANDLRWMNSGPLAGIGEIELPSLQPGSSIMPGKVNPVIPEAVTMVCAQVIGNDTTVTVAGQSGNFQLNVMLPVIVYNCLQSIDILSSGIKQLAKQCIEGFHVNHEKVSESVGKNPILVTALNPVIGYELGAKIAKKAYQEKRSVIEVTKEMTDLSEQEIKVILDPIKLTLGGLEKE